MNRRNFLLNTLRLSFVSSGYLLLNACGGSGGGGYGGGSNTATGQGGNCLANGTLVSIQVVHVPNHTLTIPAADVAAGVAKNYALEDNGSGHTHTVLITAADFMSLQANNGVMEVSTLTAGHTHNVTVNCA